MIARRTNLPNPLPDERAVVHWAMSHWDAPLGEFRAGLIAQIQSVRFVWEDQEKWRAMVRTACSRLMLQCVVRSFARRTKRIEAYHRALDGMSRHGDIHSA